MPAASPLSQSLEEHIFWCYVFHKYSWYIACCRYTRPEHPDYEPLSQAHASMKEIAVMINERKRKMESVEKIATWQDTLEDWEVIIY